ncbi:AHH domain-containing protein [Bradyrhizobium sp. RT6a]|uniref:AHH domain-containing protein n=1 Tax=unclassified Bradyrhizobium TaxID=2631580 RepID=UPI003397A61D
MRSSILWGHHIIPEHCGRHEALQGVDLDAPANIVYLPRSRLLAAEMGVSPHPGGHLESYYAACKELDAIAEISDSILRLKAVEDLQDAMRIALANEDLYTNTPSSGADVTPGNKSLLAGRGKYLADYPEEQNRIRELRRTGSHLIKFSPYLGNFEREKQLSKTMADNPGLNLTPGHKDLKDTPWSKFTPLDPSSSTFRIPGSTPVNPSEFPPLPGYSSPSLAGLNATEGFARSDPRFAGGVPAFPLPGPDEQRLGKLPPSTAMPPSPQVLQFNPETSDLLRRSDGSPLMGPDPYNLPYDPADRPAVLRGLAIFGGAMVAPELLPLLPAWLPIAGTLGLTGAASSAAGAEPASGKASGVSAIAASQSGAQQRSDNSLDQNSARANNFTDRFGQWTAVADGAMPAQPSGIEAPVTPGSGAIPPEEVRRLTRVNESNAGSVFTSGSAPVPYLPSTEFNDRFGNWTMPTADGRPLRPSIPIGPFANEPSYFIPPPIFGVDGAGSPHNDAEEWYARWIRPLLRPE